MKILYLLFAFLFLAFLSEPSNAQRQCHRAGGCCFHHCRKNTVPLGKLDCTFGTTCCRPFRGNE